MTKFKLIHLFFITVFILLGGYCLLWLFYNFIPKPYPNREIYMLLLIYIIMITITGFIHHTSKVNTIHRIIGLGKFKQKYLIITIIMSGTIWIFDHFLQIKLFNIDIYTYANKWIVQSPNISATLISMVIFGPIIEEMLFRGILLRTLNQYLSQFWTVLLTSIVFSIIHFSIVQAIPLFFAAVFYAWITFRSKSIIPAIVAHILNNGITSIYYLLLLDRL